MVELHIDGVPDVDVELVAPAICKFCGDCPRSQGNAGVMGQGSVDFESQRSQPASRLFGSNSYAINESKDTTSVQLNIANELHFSCGNA